MPGQYTFVKLSYRWLNCAQNQAPNVSLGQERFGVPEIRLREEGGVLRLCPLTALLSQRVLPGSLASVKEVASDILFLSSFIFLKGKIHFILLTFVLSVGVFWLPHMSVYQVHAEFRIRSPETKVMSGHEPSSYGCWELNLGLLLEKQELSTADSSL